MVRLSVRWKGRAQQDSGAREGAEDVLTVTSLSALSICPRLHVFTRATILSSAGIGLCTELPGGR